MNLNFSDYARSLYYFEIPVIITIVIYLKFQIPVIKRIIREFKDPKLIKETKEKSELFKQRNRRLKVA